MDELGITATEEPVYNFLGLIWNTKENDLRPNSYFTLNKRRAGLKSGSLTECAEEDDSFLEEVKSKNHSTTPLKILCSIL